MRTRWRLAACAVSAATGVSLLVGAAGQATANQRTQPDHAPGCSLGNGIRHVISIQFDNVHFTRDNPNVPSDLEQMPHVLSFLERNGTMLSNYHDVLVHTATNFLSSLTGLYEDRTSATQSNSYSYFDAAGATHSAGSFAYWTAPINDFSGHPADPDFTMNYTANPGANPTNTNIDAPAPWVPYTRAGCDVGQVGMANTVLENLQTDLPTVFGANSPEQAEATANPNKATADFVGLAVHCAAGSAVCATGRTDALPDEPGGYAGHQALFGAAEIAPVISPGGLTAISGSVINDGRGNDGFPGFDSLTADNSLGMAATMQEHGVPVTNVYVSDVHGDHTAANTGDLGPGEALYTRQLHDYDTAFGAFLARLRKDGITPANTLFSITTDEGDHFSGSAPTPANCTGAVGNACTYDIKSEVNVNLPGLLATRANDTTAFAIHSDPAPSLWVTGNPAANSAGVRALGRDISGLTITNPLTGGTEKVANQIADPAEEKILHFVGPDPNRTATLTFFSGEDSFVTSGAPSCAKSCVFANNSPFSWNHGGLFPDMQTIFLGLVGPGVRDRGLDARTWADQVDLRPTLMALTGLRDDYRVDGRVLTEALNTGQLPRSLRQDRPALTRLGAVYKQIEAVDGQFAMSTLAASTRGIASGSAADDSRYVVTEGALTRLGQRRDDLVGRIQGVLADAEFHNRPVDGRYVRELIDRANTLLADAGRLARS